MSRRGAGGIDQDVQSAQGLDALRHEPLQLGYTDGAQIAGQVHKAPPQGLDLLRGVMARAARHADDIGAGLGQA